MCFRAGAATGDGSGPAHRDEALKLSSAWLGWETGPTPGAGSAPLQWSPGRDPHLPPGVPQPDRFPGIQTEVLLPLTCAYLNIQQCDDEERLFLIPWRVSVSFSQGKGVIIIITFLVSQKYQLPALQRVRVLITSVGAAQTAPVLGVLRQLWGNTESWECTVHSFRQFYLGFKHKFNCSFNIWIMCVPFRKCFKYVKGE